MEFTDYSIKTAIIIMIRPICLCLALVAYSYAETCDMETVHQCVKSGLGTPPPMGDMKAKFEKCFTDASCKVPQRGGDKGKSDDASKQCRKAIMDKVKSDVEKCVQKTNANFKFPTKDHKFGHHDFGGGEKGKGGDSFFDKMLNQSCPNAQAQSSVKTCLQALKPAGTPPPKGAWADKKKAFCQKEADCFAKLSSTCQKTLTDTKTAVCQCAKDVVTPQAVQLESSLEACRPANGQPGNKFHGSTRKPHTPGERLIEKFCKKGCAKN
uniref:Uncharacterized protein n=1 Tax=Romanomermis culicivorax TaxID=13658 RepID=A0A915HRF9_ROMCU